MTYHHKLRRLRDILPAHLVYHCTQYLEYLAIRPRLIKILQTHIEKYAYVEQPDVVSSVMSAARLLEVIDGPKQTVIDNLSILIYVYRQSKENGVLSDSLVSVALQYTKASMVTQQDLFNRILPRIKRDRLIATFDVWYKTISHDEVDRRIRAGNRSTSVFLHMAREGYATFSATFKKYFRYQPNHILLEYLVKIDTSDINKSFSEHALWNYVLDHSTLSTGIHRYVQDHNLI